MPGAGGSVTPFLESDPVLGDVDDSKIVAKFQGDDQVICRSLFLWVNAGSHSIFDDLDYSSTPATVEANLSVFRRIFEEQGQLGHYQMMMMEEEEPPSPALSPSA